MKKEMREKIIAFNIKRAEGDQAAKDIAVIFAALNPGQRKQLVKNEAVKEIFDRRGIEY